MNQRGYTIAFAVVLLAVCLGAFFGGRYIYKQIVGGPAAAGAAWVPPEQRTPQPVVVTTSSLPQEVGTLEPAPTSAPASLPTLEAVLTPFVPPSPTFEPTDTPAPPTVPILQVETETVTPLLTAAYEYVAATPRNTNGDCAGNLILGRVVDRNGKPVAGLRMHLTDEYGVENTVKLTKSEPVDLGRYDFPLSGPGRHYFLRIEDGSGQPISEVVDIAHGIGSTSKASCHWVDWKQQ